MTHWMTGASEFGPNVTSNPWHPVMQIRHQEEDRACIRIRCVAVLGRRWMDGWAFGPLNAPKLATPKDEEGFVLTSTWIPYLPCHREADRFMPKVLSGSPYVRRTCGTKEKGGGPACPTPHSTYSDQSGLQESFSTAKWPFYEKTPTLDQIPDGAAAAAKWRHACSH